MSKLLINDGWDLGLVHSHEREIPIIHREYQTLLKCFSFLKLVATEEILMKIIALDISFIYDPWNILVPRLQWQNAILEQNGKMLPCSEYTCDIDVEKT